METWKILDDFIAFALRRPLIAGGADYRWRSDNPPPRGATDFTPAIGERILSLTAGLRPSHAIFINHHLKRSSSGPGVHSVTFKEYATLLFPREERLLDYTKLCCLFAFLADLAVECAYRKDYHAFAVLADNALNFINIHLHPRLKRQGGFKEFFAYCMGTSNSYQPSDFIDVSAVKEKVDEAVKQRMNGIARAFAFR